MNWILSFRYIKGGLISINSNTQTIEVTMAILISLVVILSIKARHRPDKSQSSFIIVECDDACIDDACVIVDACIDGSCIDVECVDGAVMISDPSEFLSNCEFVLVDENPKSRIALFL